MANLVANIGSDMGWYKWYVGKAMTGELPERFDAMVEESNEINNIINASADSIILNDELLREFKSYIVYLIDRENELLKQLKIKFKIVDISQSIKQIEDNEFEKGQLLTEKLKLATQEGSCKAILIEYLTSKSFLDKIAKRGAMMSFTVAGGGNDFQTNNAKQRSAGKTKIEKILKKVLSKRNKDGAKELLDFLMGQDDKAKTEAELKTIDSLIAIIDEEILNTRSQLMVNKGKRLTRSEQKIKTWFKQLSKKLSQQAKKDLIQNNELISESMQNLIDGNLIPVNSVFALQLNDYIDDTRGMYQDTVHSVFYTENDIKKEQISVNELANSLYELILKSLDNTKDNEKLREWLKDNRKNIVQIFIKAWSSRDLSTDFDVYNKSNISNVCGIVATTLLFSDISDDISIKLNTVYNQLKQLSATDMELSLFDKAYGIQIKNYTSENSSITLYDDTEFNLMSQDANRYISPDLLRCIRFLLINSSILNNEMNIRVDRTAIKKLLTLELATFLRIDDYKAEANFQKNVFFVINGKIYSSAYILCQAYKQAQKIIEKGSNYDLFQIIGSTTTDYVDEDADIKGALPVKYDPFMFDDWGTSIKINEIWYPKMIRESNNNLACNISLKFKGIRVKL